MLKLATPVRIPDNLTISSTQLRNKWLKSALLKFPAVNFCIFLQCTSLFESLPPRNVHVIIFAIIFITMTTIWLRKLLHSDWQRPGNPNLRISHSYNKWELEQLRFYISRYSFNLSNLFLNVILFLIHEKFRNYWVLIYVSIWLFWMQIL